VTKRETGRDLPGFREPGRVCEGEGETGCVKVFMFEEVWGLKFKVKSGKGETGRGWGDWETWRDLPEFGKPGRVCEGMEAEVKVKIKG